MSSVAELVELGHRFIIVCEGTCEEVVIEKLLEGNRLLVPKDRIVDIVRRSSVETFTDRHLNYDYDWPVTILRVVDSRSERFRLKSLYAKRFEVKSFVTRPEIEMLAIVREGKFKEYSKVKSNTKPSVYCKQRLGMRDIKSRQYLEGYWADVNVLVDAIMEYRRLAKLKSGELCLADLVC